MSEARTIGLVGDTTAPDREATAFEAALRPLLPMALRLATGMLFDAAAAEDAVQEASFQAWRRRANRRLETDLGPWFYGIVANRCREQRRGRWARVLRFATPPESPQRSGLDPTGAADVRDAMRRLPGGARLALVLRFYLDLSYEEVARVLGCSAEAAKSRVRRATAAMEPALRVPETLR